MSQRPPSSRYSQAPASSRSSRPVPARYPQQQSHKKTPATAPRGWTCNKCKKALATTVFVCSCDCVFCEDCTYSHFQSSSTCPTCSRPLQSSDLLELVVANPTSATENSLRHTFQSLFTKRSPNSSILSYDDTCYRLFRSFGNDIRITRFLLKQFVVERKSTGHNSGGCCRITEDGKKQLAEMKQTRNTRKIQGEQTLSELQHRRQALQVKTQEQQNVLDGMSATVSQLRQPFSQDGATLIPSSSHSRGSGSSRGSRDSRGRPNVAPPLQGFLVQKQVRERAKTMEIQNAKRSSAPLKTRPHDMQSIITPITPVPPPNQQTARKRGLSSSHNRLDISHTRNVSASSGYASSYSSRSSRPGSSGRGSLLGYRR